MPLTFYIYSILTDFIRLHIEPCILSRLLTKCLGSLIHKYSTDPTAKELNLQLDKLRLADGAFFDSALYPHETTCMDQTRVDLLQELREWSSKPQSPILWLSGMAGTGKSTIARTVAEYLYTNQRLAGSFFFRRAGKLSKVTDFVTTLAHQLAFTPRPGISPSFKELIAEAILSRDILEQGLRRQWKELIVGPLCKIESRQRLALTFVIDALDECNSGDDIRLILSLFIELTNIKNVTLTVLVTSRPDPALVRWFRNTHEITHRKLDLREIPGATVENDLRVYMRNKLGQIDSKTEADWPSEEDLVSLVERADGLFIYAATICLFIENSRYDTPADCLSKILLNRATGSGDTHRIDNMYSQVLDSALARPGPSIESEIEIEIEMTEQLTNRFKIIVGSIVALLEMLSVTALSNLLSMKTETVRHSLDWLESVLDIPSDPKQPIHLLHPSFRDFLLEKARSKRFHVHGETAHASLVIRCLDVLRQGLKRYICNSGSPDPSPRQISEHALNDHIPKHVQYACKYWIEHLDCTSPQKRPQLGLCDGGRIHNFFRTQFLYWMEAMSLIGKMPETVLMMNTLSTLLKVSDGVGITYNGKC